MFEFLTKKTVKSLGISGHTSFWIDAHKIWAELDKGNKQSEVIKQSNIVGEALTKVAIRTINKQFLIQKEHVFTQDVMVSELIAKLYEFLIYKGKLYRAFPTPLDTDQRARKFVSYIYTAARNHLYNLINKEVNRKNIADFESIDEKIAERESQEGSADSYWNELSENVDTRLTDPQERSAIIERLREIVDGTEIRKKSIRDKAITLLENMDERVVIANNHFGFMSFKNPTQFLKKLPDYELLDEYIFYEVQKNSKIDKQYFSKRDHETIDQLNENLDKIMKEFGDKGEKFKSKAAAMIGEGGAMEQVRIDTLVGVPLFEDVDLRFFDKETAKLNRDYYMARDIDKNLEQIIDALMIQDFKKSYYQRMEEDG